MPIPFSDVCDLLEQSYRLCQARKSNVPAVHEWFRRHRTRIDAHDTGLAALLSTLMPEKRTDLVYCIQAPTLEKIIGRALTLGVSRMKELAAYKRPGTGLDLADCVERILSVTPNAARSDESQVTVEEVDQLLHGLASRIRWSSPSIRKSSASVSQNGSMDDVYQRLSPRDAKWFTRLVLKDYQPLIFDAHLIYRSCHPLLPCILQIRDDFTEALGAIPVARGSLLPTGSSAAQNARRVLAAIKPKLGVKVGRQQWLKGRSIKHCIDIGSGRMSVETKMDGEYCQIHVDMCKPKRRVQIFSKSGKDSTEDRQAVIPAIERALRLGADECAFQKACILEGELVVYNILDNTVMPFHKIRGHVTRRGLHLHTEQDSQPKPYEHLMMVFYDIFLLDDQSLMDVRHSERMKLLEKVVHREHGVAELVQRQSIDFSHALAASTLRKAFARVIIERGEGLVLKPDEPYIVIGENGKTKPCRCIKLKKEYIGSFGDVGDFAIVGAGFDAAKAKTYRIPNLQWTHFYVGCLNNKEEVKRWGRKPELTVVCVVELSEALLQSFIAQGDITAVPRAENQSTELVVPLGVQCTTGGLTVAFTNPVVVDLRCFSFDRPGNTGFWTPRFPAVSKIHADRDYSDVLTFDELQALAREAVEKPALEDSQENLHWIAKLEGADPRGIAVDAVSQATATTVPTPSPAQMTQSSGSRADSQSQSSRDVAQTGRLIRSAVPVSSEREGTARMDASISIITISSTSASEQSSSQKPVMDDGPMKRRQGNASPELSLKRQCTHSFRHKPALQPIRETPARQPLRDMNVNISHDTQPADSRESQATVKLDPQHAKQERNAAAAAAKQQAIEILSSDDEDDDEQPAQRRSSQSASLMHTRRILPEPAPPAPMQEKSGMLPSARRCRHAGAACRLVGKTILLSSAALLRVPEVTALLDDHGIGRAAAGVTPCVEAWWEEEEEAESRAPATRGREEAAAAVVLQSGGSSKQSRMLLVDSVGQSAETRALMGRLDDARRRGCRRREERDWITVYDWRVLRHISIAEDVTVVKKYYDGFQDPWRRWYCGLV